METEPLVNNSRMMDYSSKEDGSSILNPQSLENDDLPNPVDKPDPDKINQTVLERFHEDALQQVGHGKMQFILFAACGLVIAADLSELMALIMSSKSAQFEFCVDDSQKSWLVGATLMGMGIGSAFWGSLGDRIGRRKSLISCLGVGSIFSLASVIMPTEGTFLTARILSGLGLGGCFPLAVTYYNEFVQEKRIRLATVLLFLCWPIGGAYVIMMSWFLLPSTGFHLSEELKLHFSAWRRLLLASSAPTLFSLIIFIFLPEAPLNLMQNGRDAESLSVYKRIHKANRGRESTFCFSEIEIPSLHIGSPSPSSVIADLKKALEALWLSFLVLWSENRRKLTITLTLIWLMSAIGQGALASWVLSLQATLRDWTFDKDAKLYDNISMAHSNVTTDLKNVRYTGSNFTDVSIENIMMNHVKFESCIFQRVNFTNVKASYVLFIHSNLSDCFFVDTDLGRSNFPKCFLENITYAGLDPTCHLIPDFNMELENDMLDSGLPVFGIHLGTILAATLIYIGIFARSKLIAIFLVLATCVSIGFTFFTVDPTLALLGHTVLNVVIASMWGILATVSDKYPTWTRGGALGLCSAAGRIGSFFGVGLFGTTLHGIIVPIFSSIFLVLPAILAFRSQF